MKPGLFTQSCVPSIITELLPTQRLWLTVKIFWLETKVSSLTLLMRCGPIQQVELSFKWLAWPVNTVLMVMESVLLLFDEGMERRQPLLFIFMWIVVGFLFSLGSDSNGLELS